MTIRSGFCFEAVQAQKQKPELSGSMGDEAEVVDLRQLGSVVATSARSVGA